MQSMIKFSAFSALLLTFIGAAISFLFGLIFVLNSGVSPIWDYKDVSTGFGIMVFGEFFGYAILTLGSLVAMLITSCLLIKLYKVEVDR